MFLRRSVVLAEMFYSEDKTDMASRTGENMVLQMRLCLLLATPLWSQGGYDPLRSGFENPPASAHPRVWWHWMNGNITKEGIKLDLDWMHRVGIAGFQNFDAALATPHVVGHRLANMTPE